MKKTASVAIAAAMGLTYLSACSGVNRVQKVTDELFREEFKRELRQGVVMYYHNYYFATGTLEIENNCGNQKALTVHLSLHDHPNETGEYASSTRELEEGDNILIQLYEKSEGIVGWVPYSFKEEGQGEFGIMYILEPLEKFVNCNQENHTAENLEKSVKDIFNKALVKAIPIHPERKK